MPNITNKTLGHLKPQEKDHFVRDGALRGFAVKVTPAGRISYVAEARVRGGGTRRKTLGQYPAMNLTDARALAANFINLAQQGIDPVEQERQRARKQSILSKSLAQVFDEYLAARELRVATAKNYTNVVNLAFEDWLAAPVRDISRQDVERRFVEIREQRGVPIAGYAFRILAALMNFAMADEVSSERLLTENPVDVLKQKRYKRTAPKRSRFLSEDEIYHLVEFFFTARDWPETPKHGVTDQGVNYVMLLLLTGLRRSEALGLTWGDIDLYRMVLVAKDTKNHTDHYVPISKTTDWILKRQREVSGESKWVFPARYGTGHMTEPRSQLDRIRKATGLQFTFHDLRRTFASHAAANGVEYDLIRRALNHKSGGGVTDQYIIPQVDMLRPVFDAVADVYRRYVDG